MSSPQTPHSKRHSVMLHNGGVLSITIYGDTSLAKPVVYLHGFPGSHLEASAASTLALALGLSLIAIDRPGYGDSTNNPNLAIVEFPSLVAEALEFLKIGKCSILTVSGGTPYGVACAAQLGERVSRVVILSGVSPYDNDELLQGMVVPNKSSLTLAKNYPAIARITTWCLASWWRVFPSHMLLWFKFWLAGADREIISDPQVAKMLIENLREALKNGVGGAIREIVAMAAPWGIDFSKVTQPVKIWHGDDDRYVPLAMGQYMTKLLPNAELKIVPGQGHFMAFGLLGDALKQCVEK